MFGLLYIIIFVSSRNGIVWQTARQDNRINQKYAKLRKKWGDGFVYKIYVQYFDLIQIKIFIQIYKSYSNEHAIPSTPSAVAMGADLVGQIRRTLQHSAWKLWEKRMQRNGSLQT